MITIEDAVAEATNWARSKLDDDVIAPWHIFWYLRTSRARWTTDEISQAAAEVLDRLVSAGAVLGDITRLPLAVRPWPDQSSVVSRVAEQWRAIERDPAPGEFGYLDKPVGPPGPTATSPSSVSDRPVKPGDAVAASAPLDDAIAQVIDDLWSDLSDDVLGPWEIFLALRDARDQWTKDEIQQAAETVLSGLIAKGAVFGELSSLTNDFKAWPDQDGGVSQVTRAWNRLDRDPGLGEICWIAAPRSSR